MTSKGFMMQRLQATYKVLMVMFAVAQLQQHILVAYAKCQFVGGNFSHYCSDIQLLPGGITLSANCGDPPNSSQIYLDAKIGNEGGALRCEECWGFLGLVEKNCNFSHSCSDISLDGTVLSATCGDGRGSQARSAVNLDDCILNNRGTLDWMC